MITTEDLQGAPAHVEDIPSRIPSMGGAAIGPFLRSLAREASPGTSIVEVGTWLGAGTAHLALGVRDRGATPGVDIHCFDGWTAMTDECVAALEQKAVRFTALQDTLPWVRETLAPIGAPIQFHKGDIGKATWAGGPISVYIDDAAKGPEAFLHVLKTFGPHWIPGKTVVVLMDYYYWKKLTGWRADVYRCQQSFIERYAEHFTVIKPFREQHDVPFSNEAFRYEKRFDFAALTSDEFPRTLRSLIPDSAAMLAHRIMARIGLG